MLIIHAARLSRAPMAGLTAIGFFWGTFAAYIPEFKLRAGVGDAELGRALMLTAAGGILAMSSGPRIGKRLGRAALPVAAMVLAGAAFLPMSIGSIWTMAAAIFGMGLSLSFLDINANIRISVLEERHGLHLMNLNHAMFSFGFAGSALAASLARQADLSPEAVFPCLALAIAALGLLMAEGTFWAPAAEPPQDADHKGLWRLIAPAAAILFAAFVSENAADSFSALHIEQTLHGRVGEGGLGPMMLGLAMGLGRLSGQVAARRLGEAGLILWSAALGVAGALVTALAPTPLVAMGGVGLLGLGVAVTVPSANSILGKLVRPDQRGTAISRAWMVGFTGFFIGPVLMGEIAERAGLRWSFAMIALVMSAILICVWPMGRPLIQR
ncbi:MAG: MFS transporter [Rhodobacteraceae bacterium]|nr:MFS transporter [Paracoccaceae bacterium]